MLFCGSIFARPIRLVILLDWLCCLVICGCVYLCLALLLFVYSLVCFWCLDAYFDYMLYYLLNGWVDICVARFCVVWFERVNDLVALSLVGNNCSWRFRLFWAVAFGDCCLFSVVSLACCLFGVVRCLLYL